MCIELSLGSRYHSCSDSLVFRSLNDLKKPSFWELTLTMHDDEHTYLRPTNLIDLMPIWNIVYLFILQSV